MSDPDDVLARAMLDEMARRSARLTELARQPADAAALDDRRVLAALGRALREGLFPDRGPACARCGFPTADGRCDLCEGLRDWRPATAIEAGGEAVQGGSEAEGGWPEDWRERLSAFASALEASPPAASREAEAPSSRRRRPRKAPRGTRAADGSWTCGHCGHFNSAKARLCFECGYAAPEPSSNAQ
jgi:hypothetical protein